MSREKTVINKPVIRDTVVKLKQQKEKFQTFTEIYKDYHNIICDGTSFGQILKHCVSDILLLMKSVFILRTETNILKARKEFYLVYIEQTKAVMAAHSSYKELKNMNDDNIFPFKSLEPQQEASDSGSRVGKFKLPSPVVAAAEEVRDIYLRFIGRFVCKYSESISLEDRLSNMTIGDTAPTSSSAVEERRRVTAISKEHSRRNRRDETVNMMRNLTINDTIDEI